MKLNIILDMFPNMDDNPRWNIDGKAAKEILDKFEMLPDAEPVVIGKNGNDIEYRGFILINVDDDPAFPENIRVYEGVIITTEHAPADVSARDTKYYADERNIEALLAGMAIG